MGLALGNIRAEKPIAIAMPIAIAKGGKNDCGRLGPALGNIGAEKPMAIAIPIARAKGEGKARAHMVFFEGV